MNHMNGEMEEIYAAVEDCLRACNQCYEACLSEEEVSHMRECIRTDRECADVCELTLKAISTNSPHVREIISLCAKVAEDCGKECASHKHDHCQMCAEACHLVSELCGAYVS
ncbi:four-helix bundle copper-binding protein [Alteribacter aurantiacus]|uniref:four-helix bundle copper-binding protein n=1 Tax=Alteribacter aurantiacus TaxID=254410 RepID=UPI003CCC4273